MSESLPKPSDLCPTCGQTINEEIMARLQEHRAELWRQAQAKKAKALEDARNRPPFPPEGCDPRNWPKRKK